MFARMKAPVSILDRIFRGIQQLAAGWVITARLNKIYGREEEDSSLDPALAALQRRTLERNS
jgi:hypothetical protein